MRPDSKTIRWSFAVALAMLVLSGGLARQQSQADGQVDLLLVIALDVSASVDAREFLLMQQGLANSINSPEVAMAISRGKHRSIAVSVLQWSGFIEKKIGIPWTRISNLKDLKHLADTITTMPRYFDSGATDIGGSINYSMRWIKSAPFTASRKVIDIASDGINNVNRSPHFDRDEALKAGIDINALAITGQGSGLGEYFARFVIGGKGAFVEIAQTFADFERAMHRKLVREIGESYLF